MHERAHFRVVPSGYGIFRRGDEVLLLRRQNTGYRDGFYSLPAGHIEKAEFALPGALREIREETGVDLAPEQMNVAHIMHRHCGDHHRVDFFFEITDWEGTPINCEKDKCDDLSWYSLDALPNNTIPYIHTALHNYAGGIIYSEYDEGPER